MDRFLLLPLGAAIALVWANVAGESYFRFAHSLAFPVNEIGMALFLGLIVQEAIEATMPGGGLHTWRLWTLPLVGAAGGIGGSALTYLAYIYLKEEELLWQAWPIAIAIDLAAGYYVLKAIYKRSGALPFLLVLGIATNAVGLVVMAAWPAVGRGHVWAAVLLVAAVGVAAMLRRRQVRSFWPYLLVPGVMSWFAFYLAGVSPALALVPIVPFIRREPRGLDLFADPPEDDDVHRAEHEWNEVVQIVVFLFGLVNAGVLLRGHDTGSWALLTAAVIGRPLGILGAVAVAAAAGLRFPRGAKWSQIVVAALAASSGFTFALFFATGLLPMGAILQQIKYGALLSAVGAPIAVGAAWWLREGRFRSRALKEGGHGVSPQAQ